METIRFTILPILVAAGASTLGSFAWYALFLKKDSQVFKEEAVMKKSLKNIFRTSFLAHIFSAAAIYMLINIFQIRTFAQGSGFILAVCFFLIALSGIKKVVVENKSMENFILGAGHDFVNIVVAFYVLIALAN